MSTPLYLDDKQSIVRFVTSFANQKQWVQCYGHGPRTVFVSVGHMGKDAPHTRLHGHVLPLVEGNEVGFAFVLHVQTDLDCNGWTIADSAPALQAGLWPCVADRNVVLLRKLGLYRKWVLKED